MVIPYIFLLLPLTYSMLLLVLLYLHYQRQKFNQQLCRIEIPNGDPNRVESTTRSDISTLKDANQKPTYKKANLTIQIPESPGATKVPVFSLDPDNIFLKQFLQENCFPLFMWHKSDKGMNQLDKLTVLYMNLCAEAYILIGLYQVDMGIQKEGTIAMIYGVIALLIAVPLASLFTMQLVVWGKHTFWTVLKWSWMGLNWLLMVGLPILSVFVIDEDETEMKLLFSWVFVFIIELIFLEPFRALIKVGCYMHSRNNDSCYNFFNKL